MSQMLYFSIQIWIDFISTNEIQIIQNGSFGNSLPA